MPLSAGDWIRLKRVTAARNYGVPTTGVLATKKDITNVAQRDNPFNPDTMNTRVVGLGRTRREASKWTDYVASRAQDFVLQSRSETNNDIVVNRLTKVNCDCGTITDSNTTTIYTKSTGCGKCRSL